MLVNLQFYKSWENDNMSTIIHVKTYFRDVIC